MSAAPNGRGVVAAGDDRTAEAGAQLLREGGTAVDAAVGAVFAAWAAEPVLTAPFGGGFAAVGGGGVACAYDFFADVPGRGLGPISEQSELDFHGVDVSFGPTDQTFHVGRGATAVPHILPGLMRIHRKYGRLPISQVVEPAVALANAGVPLSGLMAPILAILRPILTLTDQTRALFAPTGDLVGAGEPFVNPDLASLLTEVGQGNLDPAKEALLQGFGPPHGRITEADLEARDVRCEKPIRVAVGKHEVLLNPPPSSGGLLIGFGLRLLEGIPPAVWKDDTQTAKHVLASMAVTSEARAQTLVEGLKEDEAALKRTAASFLGDAYVDQWREPFLRAARDGPTGHGFPRVDLGSTTHVSVVDADGLACAITSSNGEGCGHLVRGAGAMANNFMGEEDLHPQGFHQRPAGSRLSSMMCPTVVLENDQPCLVIGTGGSNRIRTALLQVLVNCLMRGMPLTEAVGAPRMHYEGQTLYVEEAGPRGRMAASTLAELAGLSAETVKFDTPNIFFGGVHAAAVGGEAAGDARRGGAVRHA